MSDIPYEQTFARGSPSPPAQPQTIRRLHEYVEAMSTRAEEGVSASGSVPYIFGPPAADAALLEALGVATPESLSDEAKARAALSDVITKVCTHTWALPPPPPPRGVPDLPVMCV